MTEVAKIMRNNRGGWSLLLPSAGNEIGNYATVEDAKRVARMNRYEVDSIQPEPDVAYDTTIQLRRKTKWNTIN